MLISHLGISVAGINPGVSAVAIFYLLAGRVVSRLWREQPERGVISGGVWFYRDRLWRILPLYMFALVVAFIVWLLGASSPFLLREPEMTDWLANLLIVPLSYYMYSGQDAFTLLPPAWSLGVELQFYLLVPLLLSRPLWAVVFSALSFLTFCSAQLGWLDTTPWAQLADISYQWLRNDVEIDSTNNDSYVRTEDDVGVHVSFLLSNASSTECR
ncbi:acyltransferase family protein [Stutzerimonas stutzeri]|uniref:Acyltransferase 3 domain-containing protein n=1 Tax=Stutzerimonas stutzeri KOS6 TaxID=1218352 RepID=A0A061JLZ0_STUST|nr:acyltransferase family protein [Stutzerimonas stutzeri]EWC39209.1 hypothetical protein B597_021370 [Stutzerimonas stutzeri KOS6]